MVGYNFTFIASGLFVVVYVVYYFTSFPSVTGGDSGELLAEACQLGTSHPPGYPLFTMLSHLASVIPIPRMTLDTATMLFAWDTNASVAWRVNHLCAFLGAATATLLWLCSKTITRLCQMNEQGYLSVIGAFAYAFSPLIWEYSTTAEVFALNNFLCACILSLTCFTAEIVNNWHIATVSSADQRNNRYIEKLKGDLKTVSLLGGLSCGLVLANQHASFLLVVCVVPYIAGMVWIYAGEILTIVLSRAAVGFMAGFSTYLYLPWAAQQHTFGSWGDLGSLNGIIRHILRSEYGTFRLGMIIGSETALQRIIIYLKHTSEESNHLIFPIVLIGAAVCCTYLNYVPTGWSRKPPPKALTLAASNKQKQQDMTQLGIKGKGKRTVSSSATASSASAVNNITVPAKSASSGRVLHSFVAVAAMWIFYTIVWHGVLSNLPLSSPMPFAVHSRFWMQPNILLYTLMCAGIDVISWLLSSTTVTDHINSRKFSSKRVTYVLLELSIIVLYLSSILYQRYDSMDKSRAGDVMLLYGKSLLSAAMQRTQQDDNSYISSSNPVVLHSLVLSHTDLDWNPTRYLQHCEAVGIPPESYYRKSPLRSWAPALWPSAASTATETATVKGGEHSLTPLVTQLSFQTMPYPWFAQTQAPLYPHVKFPDLTFTGISTDRKSEGNAQMIMRFLYTNGLHNITYRSPAEDFEKIPVLRSPHSVFTGGVYLDMQAVHEAEIESLGQWRGTMLIPWGTLYRVFGHLGLPQVQELHHHSWYQLQQLQETFPKVDDTFMHRFIPGSWERAAANVYYDAHYQFGVNLLTFCIEVQGKIELRLLPILLDRYFLSANVLWQTKVAVEKYETFSSSLLDLSKNTALAWMRLHALLGIVDQFGKEIKTELNRLKLLPTSARTKTLLSASSVERLLTAQGAAEVRISAYNAMSSFLRDYPQDRDASAFSTALSTINI